MVVPARLARVPRWLFVVTPLLLLVATTTSRTCVNAWSFVPAATVSQRRTSRHHHTTSNRLTTTTPTTSLKMAAIGIFFGTSTGNTQTAAELIYEAFGEDVAAEPIDVDSLEEGKIADTFLEHDAIVVGTPTWNTGADSERSGTGWDELYYDKLPDLEAGLRGKKVAVFGLGDQISYAENYADATGELFDVFENLGCTMLGSWSQDGYEHEASKSIRGDKFCGLLLDEVNQEELTEERVQQWVAQLLDEGILEGGGGGGGGAVTAQKEMDDDFVNGLPSGADDVVDVEPVLSQLEKDSTLLDQTIGSHSTGGYVPHYNPVKGKTLWTSPDGRKSYVTTELSSKFGP